MGSISIPDLDFDPLDTNRSRSDWYGDLNGPRSRVIADSVNPDGIRITTYEAILWRPALPDFNTHRMLSRNSASSRAIPIQRYLSSVLRNPAGPVRWGRNQAGMQARSDLVGWRRALARRLFYLARFPVLVFAWLLWKVGLHKQVVNRLLEPWMWQTIVVTMTSDENFFNLRDSDEADPSLRATVVAMKQAKAASQPIDLEWGDWHLPYVNRDWGDHHLERDSHFEVPMDVVAVESARDTLGAKVSAACCARVSYVRQNERKSIEEDVSFADRLARNGHFSPLEHPAQAERGRWGNFDGWKQLRKFYPNESGEAPRDGR